MTAARSPLGWCRATFTSWAVIAISMVAAAQQQQEKEEAAEDVEVTLRVMDDAGAVVQGVKLWLTKDHPSFPVIQPGTDRRTEVLHTDANGLAAVHFPRARTNVMATKEGFAPLFLRGADLAAKQPYEIRLTTGRTIRGIIRDGAGNAVPGAEVTATKQNFVLSHYADFNPKGTSNDQGGFELRHATAGEFQISAKLARSPLLFAEPQVVTVKPEADPLPIAVVAKPGAVVRGRFVADEGVPVGGREVFVYTRLPKRLQWSLRSADDGSFEVSGLPPGSKGAIQFSNPRGYFNSVKMHLTHEGMKPDRTRVDFEDIRPGVYHGIEVRLLKEATAKGRVLDEAGEPVVGVFVKVEPTQYLFKTDATGSYNAKVPPETDVVLEVRSNLDVKATVRTESFRVKEGQETEKDFKVVRNVLPPSDNEIAGVVTAGDGTPVPDVTIQIANHALLPEHVMHASSSEGKVKPPTWKDGNFRPATVRSDAQGKFVFDKLYAGKTDVWAFDAKHGWAWLRGVDSDDRNVKLVLERREPGITLRGRIEDHEGNPIADARLVLFNGDHNQPKQLAEARSDEEGKYEIRVTPPAGGYLLHNRLVCVSDGKPVGFRTLPNTGGEDVNIRLREPAAVSGRVVNKRGEGLAGANVGLYLVREDPEHGSMFFFRAIEPLGPSTRSDAQGRFTLTGLAKGTNVSLRARHPEYGKGEVWYVRQITMDSTCEDIKLPDGIELSGTVRLGPTGAPAAGAAVTLGYTSDATAMTKTDEQGRYHFKGLNSYSFSNEYTRITATVGPAAKPLWEGTLRYPNRLYAGDRVRDIDVVLERSFASKHEEWKQKRGDPLASRYEVAVLDDEDPASRNKERYADTLTVYGADGTVRWKRDDLNVGWAQHAIVYSPADRTLVVALNERLAKFDLSDGRTVWEKAGVKALSVAVHPKSGDVWVPVSEGTIYGAALVVFDAKGEKRHEWKVSAHDIAYSPADDCFWTIAERVKKVDLTGKVIFDSPFKFAWLGRSITVNDRDGSAWAVEGEHPQVRDSKARVLVLDRDGTLRKDVPLVVADVALDPDRGVAWGLGDGLKKMHLDADVIDTLPVRASHLCLEPDTGYVWAVGRYGLFRVDAEGSLVWSCENPPEPEESFRRTWACAVPTPPAGP